MLSEDPDVATARRLILRDGRQVAVRAICPEDKTILDDAFERLCKEARYTRFLSVVRDVPNDILHPNAPGPGGHAVALVAISGSGSSEAMVGGARYVTDASGGTGEFAVTVADAWRGVGLARQLMEVLLDMARKRHVHRMEGSVLTANAGMRRLAARLGFKDGPCPGDYTLRLVSLDLDAAAGQGDAPLACASSADRKP